MEDMQLICAPIFNGVMVLWSEADDAARYIVTLFVKDTDISTKIIERGEKYCSFTGLADLSKTDLEILASDGKNSAANSVDSSDRRYTGIARSMPAQTKFSYFVQVQAEDRYGNIIAQSDKTECHIHTSGSIT